MFYLPNQNLLSVEVRLCSLGHTRRREVRGGRCGGLGANKGQGKVNNDGGGLVVVGIQIEFRYVWN